jgi:hypothetical protein
MTDTMNILYPSEEIQITTDKISSYGTQPENNNDDKLPHDDKKLKRREAVTKLIKQEEANERANT